MCGESVKGDGHTPFTERTPTTSTKEIDARTTPDSEETLELNVASKPSISSIVPSGSFPFHAVSSTTTGPTSSMTITTAILSGSELAEFSLSWSCPKESTVSSCPQRFLGTLELDSFDLERYFQPQLRYYHLHAPLSPDRSRAYRKMMLRETQKKTTKQCRPQLSVSSKASGGRLEGAVDVDCRAMCKCDYPGCHKTFRRSEHLKRHKQT
jgi:hypothetical protein